GETPTIPTVMWTLTGNSDPKTRITQHGTVHIGGRETANSVQIKATATIIDPDSPQGEELSRTRNITVDADAPMIPGWPQPRPGGPTEYGDGEEPIEPDPEPEDPEEPEA